jgi:fucose permease
MGTQAVAIPAISRQRSLFAVLFGGFVLTGLAITVIGPILPVFIARWSLNDAKAGLFSTVAFGSSLAGVGLSSLVTTYWGYRPSILAGYILMSVGLTGLNSTSLGVALIGAAAIGLGYGMAVPGTNLYVAEMGGSRSASLVSLVNLAWGLGALACSPLLMFSLRLHFLPQLLIGCAVLGAALTLALSFAAMPSEKHAASTTEESASAPRMTKPGVLVTAGLAMLFFVYVGTEVSFSFWAATYAKRLAGGVAEMATVAPMFFFGGLMSGRALTPLALGKIRENQLAFGALCLVLLGGLLLVVSPAQKMAFASLTLCGLGCACLFPICVAWLSRWYGAGAKGVSGIMFSLGSIGGGAMPWFVGFVSEHGGGLRTGLLVPVVNAVVMLFLIALLRRQTAAVPFHE